MLDWSEIEKYPRIVEMNKLTSEQRRGFSFEFLICNLCRCIFDLPVDHTTFTNDKGKDIVIKDGDNSIWIECKNYNRTIGTHIVSSTLVMAMLENVKKIYVFSRSPISERMVEELLGYSSLTNIEVTVVSDLELEKMIVKYRSDPRLEFEKFFPSGIIKSTDKSHPFDCYITTDRAQYYLGDIIRVSAIIKNICDKKESETYKISLSKDYFAQNGLEYLSGELNSSFSLKYCKIKRIDFKFRVAKYSNKIKIPAITITDSENEIIRSNECVVECSKLVRSFLVGDSVNIIRDVSLNKSTYEFIVVNGKSGVGKSRLMEELAIAHLKLGYRTAKIDLENVGSIDALRKIIACLYNLPFVHLDAEYVISDTEDEINNILYRQNYDFVKNRQTIADLIYKKFVDESCFIGLDNIQDADSTFIGVMNTIISKASGEAVRFRSSVFCLVFNTERLMPPEITELNLKLKGITHNFYSIKPFDEQRYTNNNSGKNNAEQLSKQFIFSCLNIAYCDKNTEKLFLELAKLCAYNPLHIQQTLQYILDKDCLNFEDDRCRISNFREYNLIMNEPLALEEIFSRRYDLLLRNCSYDGADQLKDILILICYFGEIQRYFLLELSGGVENIKKLLTTGFIVERDNNYVFTHTKIKRFFEKYFNINEDTFYLLPSHIANAIYENTAESFPLHLTSKYDCDRYAFTFDDAQKCLMFLKNGDCDIIFTLVLFRIMTNTDYFDLKEKLYITSKVISKYEKKYGVEKTVSVFSETFLRFEQISNSCLDADENQYINLVRIMANKYILLHQNKKGYDTLKKALNSLLQRNKNPNHKLLSVLYNRLSVCAGSQNKQREACQLAKLGLKDAKKIKDLHNIIENLADLGYAYYKLDKRAKCIKTWSEIEKNHIKLLKSANASDEDKQFSIYKCNCNTALLHMLSRSKKAQDSIARLENGVIKINRPFYRIKSCLLIASYYIIRLSDTEEPCCPQFFDYLKEAELIINAYGEIRSIYKVDYLYANYYYIIGDKDSALAYYKKALSELENAILDLDTFASYIFLFYDLKNKIQELSQIYVECVNHTFENYYRKTINKQKPMIGLLSDNKNILTFPIL